MSNMNDFIIENGVLTKYVGPGGDVVIPEGVTKIGEWAFYNCQGLTGVEISESVTEIGKRAFAKCSGLEKVSIPLGITQMGEWAFQSCTKLADPNGFITVNRIIRYI